MRVLFLGKSSMAGDKNMETSRERQLMDKLSPQNRVLLAKMSTEERFSFNESVHLDNIGCVASWIGTHEEVERILFWDKWGKYDDPAWKMLTPVDQITERLYGDVESFYEHLKAEAVEIQMRSDLSLYSQFNSALLFTGMAGAVRCNQEGVPDNQGAFFKGVEMRCIGSAEENVNPITIYPVAGGGFEIHFGSRSPVGPLGIQVHCGDSYSLLQLAKLIDKGLAGFGFEVALRDSAGASIKLDPKAIRGAARRGEKLPYDPEHHLFASMRVKGIEKAIETAHFLSESFYRRFGMETECYKIGRKYGNFFVMRDDNFSELLPDAPVEKKGLVLFTATLGCRRCRREIEAFRNYARLYPEVTFAIVNLNSPQTRFYERVFADMGGGDPRRFRDNPSGATPFTIIYVPDGHGVLQFSEYYGTAKAEAPPSEEACIALLDRYFRYHPMNAETKGPDSLALHG